MQLCRILPCRSAGQEQLGYRKSVRVKCPRTYVIAGCLSCCSDCDSYGRPACADTLLPQPYKRLVWSLHPAVTVAERRVQPSTSPLVQWGKLSQDACAVPLWGTSLLCGAAFILAVLCLKASATHLHALGHIRQLGGQQTSRRRTKMHALAPAEAPARRRAKMSAGTRPLLRPAGSAFPEARLRSRCNTWSSSQGLMRPCRWWWCCSSSGTYTVHPCCCRPHSEP